MVQHIPPPLTGKRKKTTDMPDSPPKRVTRARAKASADEKPVKKITKVITASAKAAASAKSATDDKVAVEKPGKTVKRKLRADDHLNQSSDKTVNVQSTTQEPVKTRGRRNKEVLEDVTDESVPDAPKRSKSRPGNATMAIKEVEQKQPKPRGRPKKVTNVPAVDTVEVSSHQEKPLSVKAATRSRTGIVTDKGVPTTLPSSTAPKKRVTFQAQPQQDKENIPYQIEAAKKTGIETKGLRAKPIRKPAAAKGSTRNRKTPAQKKDNNEEATEEKLTPLSPKKIKQMAVAGSVSSEDELLLGEKTPMRDLSISPVKLFKSPIKDDQTEMRRGASITIAPPSSPTKTTSTSIIGTPARRPPPSPFKDVLKDTPKRVNIKDLKQSALKPQPSPSKSSLHESPKRLNLGRPIAPPEFGLPQSPFRAPLLESPRRAKFVESLALSRLLPAVPSMKVSLLQSPARRPAGSPSKPLTLGSPAESSMAVPIVDGATASKQINSLKLPAFSSQGFASSPLRVAKSPEHTVKVYKITEAEQHAELTLSPTPAGPPKALENDGRFDQALMTPILKQANETDEAPIATNQALRSPPTSPREHWDSVEEPTTISLSSTPVSPAEGIVNGRSTTPPSPLPLYMVPAYSLASAVFRQTSEDSDSEDELGAAHQSYAPTPLSQYQISSKDFVTPGTCSARKTSKPSATRALQCSNVRGILSPNAGTSITPLAAQLSTWRASSPEETVAQQIEEQPENIFANMPLVDDPQDRTHVFEASPVKPHFFEDEMLIRDQEIESSAKTEDEDTLEDYPGMQLNHGTQAYEEYGDENAVPIDPQLLALTQVAPSRELVAHGITCTPAKVFYEHTRETCTVSKVPLRASAEGSLLKTSRKRSKSKRGAIESIIALQKMRFENDQTPLKASEKINVEGAQRDSSDAADSTPLASKPSNDLQSLAEDNSNTPSSTISSRRSIASNVLSGAVVYVDVHTTEGADASGIFVELLTQMGARCVKQWLWNPRSSHGTSLEGTSPAPENTTPGGKIGITHVVYKDGGKRTLEKIRESKGVVLCVGVGWVLE